MHQLYSLEYYNGLFLLNDAHMRMYICTKFQLLVFCKHFCSYNMYKSFNSLHYTTVCLTLFNAVSFNCKKKYQYSCHCLITNKRNKLMANKLACQLDTMFFTFSLHYIYSLSHIS